MKPTIRERLFQLVYIAKNESKYSKTYDVLMIVAVIVSLIPLCFKEEFSVFKLTDCIVTILFIADYVLRWSTADFALKKGARSFLIYPFTPMAIIDLLSILPFFLPVNDGLKTLRILRLLRALRVVRFLRESKSFQIVVKVLHREKNVLLSVGAMAIGYIVACALVVFNVEPDTFNSFFDAVYWACVSLTTVGYGDIYPTSEAGRIITMFSSLVGVALIALPSGIITGGYIEEMHR